MADTSENKKDSGVAVVDAVAGLLAGGGVAVAKGAGMVIGYTGKFLRVVKDTTTSFPMPSLPARGLFSGGVLKGWGGDRSNLKVNIAKAQKKIEALYAEIGKRGAKLTGVEDVTKHESVKELIDEVKSHESQIQKWQTRLEELEKERAAAKRTRAKGSGPSEKVKNSIGKAIENASKTAVFADKSGKAVFDKVTHDLLDDDVEIRLLAAAELGKTANKASIPVLKEALAYGDAYLSSEIINALITINDDECLPIFKQNINDDNFRIRLGCMRGFYKLAGTDSVPYLVDGLKDKHQEVRKSAATFLGWVGVKDAAPALTQTLKDSDQEVKQAAAMSLAILGDPSSIMPLIRTLGESSLEVREKIVHAVERITGKSVKFQIDATGDELKKNIENLKGWWQKNKMSDVDEALEEEGAPASAPEPEAKESEAKKTEPAAKAEAKKTETKKETKKTEAKGKDKKKDKTKKKDK